MIAPLRRRHRFMMLALALVVPLLFVLGVASRPEPPTLDRLPAGFDPQALPVPPATVGEMLFPEHGLAVRWSAGGGSPQVELVPTVPLALPELLVYWSSDTADGERLPAGAFLLGELRDTAPRRFTLPSVAAAGGGRLWLYSLGHQQVIASAELSSAGPGRAP